jgi:drug/metabolite transporter (DMT)-like permease
LNRRNQIDAIGALLLIICSALMGVNQVLVKIINAGLHPVFQAGLRSAFAFLPVLLYALITKKTLSLQDGSFWPGMLVGIFFGIEFLLLFQALDYTTVSRASIFFYTMPFWTALAAHFLIPGEKLTVLRTAGLLWSGIIIVARTTNLSKSTPEMQLLYQLAVSAVILLAVAPYFGELVRDLNSIHVALFTFQVLAVVCFGFLTWFWVLSVYPASSMASYSFLAPVFGVFFGWLILGEQMTETIMIALVLVSAGVYLVNRKPASARSV